ncbi:MAG: class I SAM-dependent methyltransferase [Planctomycetota bacterium]
MTEPVSIVTTASDPARRGEGDRLAARLGLSAVAPDATAGAGGLRLVVTDDRLELAVAGDRGHGVFVDLAGPARPGTRRQPLARAVGRAARTVLDATAGLGRDAALLARLGYRVTAVERCPVLASLLADGLRRLREQGAEHADRLEIVEGDARVVLAAADVAPDAVYIDPMYPPRRKATALARKRIRLVRRLVGDDPDAADLLRTARRHAPRVVVKRADDAPPLAPDPTAAFAGKTVRYDLYAR